MCLVSACGAAAGAPGKQARALLWCELSLCPLEDCSHGRHGPGLMLLVGAVYLEV